MNRTTGALMLLAIAIGGCGPEFERARWETILPGSTEPQRVIESPSVCDWSPSEQRYRCRPTPSKDPQTKP